jgi:hypothetical protein
MSIDKERFKKSFSRIIYDDHEGAAPKGIGTLGEKTLHSVLKHYYEPDESRHEIPFGGYVADIAAESGMIEIQTRQFDKLRKKLDCFLAQMAVTVVYPVARTKWLIWIDETTGEVTKKRKSPKTGQPYEVFYELYKIKSMLRHENLRICIVLVDLEEYRYLNGWSKDRKRGSTRYNRIPTDIVGEVIIGSPAEYEKLIPAELESRFTSKDFMKASGLSLSLSQTALNVLHAVGAVIRCGKNGRMYVYERASKTT